MAGDFGERVEGDAQDFVDVEGRADRGADAVQNAEVRLHVHGLRSRRALDQLAELTAPPIGRVLEGERVAVVVGADEDRRHLELRHAVRERDRERRGAARVVARAVRADLDARRADVDRRRFPLGAALLADANWQHQRRPRRPPPLRAGRVGRAQAPRAGLEARERLFQTLERDRLADEVERARPQALLGLRLGRPAGDHHDRHAHVANGVELQEIEPAHARQADVQEDGVGTRGFDRVERCFSRVRDDRLMADLVEELSEDLAQRWIVVDD